jgi:hypothetical protein
MTTLLPPNVKVHLALGFIDMRKGIDGLAMLVQLHRFCGNQNRMFRAGAAARRAFVTLSFPEPPPSNSFAEPYVCLDSILFWTTKK